MYSPPNWSEILEKTLDSVTSSRTQYAKNLVEAGADAMLMELRKQQTVIIKYYGGDIMENVKATLVVIPDDDSEGKSSSESSP